MEERLCPLPPFHCLSVLPVTSLSAHLYRVQYRYIYTRPCHSREISSNTFLYTWLCHSREGHPIVHGSTHWCCSTHLRCLCHRAISACPPSTHTFRNLASVTVSGCVIYCDAELIRPLDRWRRWYLHAIFHLGLAVERPFSPRRPEATSSFNNWSPIRTRQDIPTGLVFAAAYYCWACHCP